MSTPQGKVHAAAGKLAQLLGEVLIHHAPWTAEINEQAKERYTHKFLEGLESHIAGQVAPMLQKVLDATDAPPEIRSLIEEAIDPPAQFSAFLEQIFLYGIVSQIIGASVAPFLQGITNDVSAQAVSDGITRPVDPSVIATAAGRGLNLGDPPTTSVPDWAYTEAAKSGVGADDINLQASIVGLPPALQELFELKRRGLINDDQVKQGLREGDFRDDWIDTVVGLEHAYLTPLDFVRAAVQDQMDYATAREWAATTGLDITTQVPIDTGGGDQTPDMFGLAYATAGRPPGPEQLARMTLRGIIDKDGTGAGETTFEQGIAESDLKTKWTESLWLLSQYVPPPDAVSSLLEKGAITTDQAVSLWEQDGVPAELASGYAYIANQQHIGQDKLLARGQVVTGYVDGLFSTDQATALLGDLGYRDDVAANILAIADFRREIQAINSVVRKISNLYANFRISAANAKKALLEVGVDDAQAQAVLSTWDAVRVEPVRVPSVSEIGAAVKYGTLTQAQALDELANLGYEARDAAIVLSAHAQAQVSPLPAPGDGTIG